MVKLTGAVGRGGINRLADVRLVQGLLNNYNIFAKAAPLKVDGHIGEKTNTRIELFQEKVLLLTNPDGRVDPNGQTFKKLINRPGSKLAAYCSISNQAIDLLKSIEELALKPYDDQTGKNISKWIRGATIGYGHLIVKSDWDKYKNGITNVQALALFKKDLQPYTKKVKNTVTAYILQQEFDAMVMLIFNIGLTAFGSSSVVKLVNNPAAKTSYPCLEKAWMAWNKSQGKYNKGLVNRRKAEWRVYTDNVYKRW